MNKKIITVLVALATVATVSMYAASLSYAQESESNITTLVQRIADRFNLNTNDVQSVFNEYRDERHVAMQQNVEERLNQAVEEGKLTSEQKSSLLAIMNKHHESKEDWQDLAPEERHEKMYEHRQKMQDWMKENNLDLRDILGRGFKRKGMRGHHGDSMGF